MPFRELFERTTSEQFEKMSEWNTLLVCSGIIACRQSLYTCLQMCIPILTSMFEMVASSLNITDWESVDPKTIWSRIEQDSNVFQFVLAQIEILNYFSFDDALPLLKLIDSDFTQHHEKLLRTIWLNGMQNLDKLTSPCFLNLDILELFVQKLQSAKRASMREDTSSPVKIEELKGGVEDMLVESAIDSLYDQRMRQGMLTEASRGLQLDNVEFNQECRRYCSTIQSLVTSPWRALTACISYVNCKSGDKGGGGRSSTTRNTQPVAQSVAEPEPDAQSNTQPEPDAQSPSSSSLSSCCTSGMNCIFKSGSTCLRWSWNIFTTMFVTFGSLLIPIISILITMISIISILYMAWQHPGDLQTYVTKLVDLTKETIPSLEPVIETIGVSVNSFIQVIGSIQLQMEENARNDQLSDSASEYIKSIVNGVKILEVLKVLNIDGLLALLEDEYWRSLFITNTTYSNFETVCLSEAAREKLKTLNANLQKNGVYNLCKDCLPIEDPFVKETYDKTKTIVSLYNHVTTTDPTAVQWTTYCTPTLEQPLVKYIDEHVESAFPVGKRVCVMHDTTTDYQYLPIKDNTKFKEWVDLQTEELHNDPDHVVKKPDNVLMITKKEN